MARLTELYVRPADRAGQLVALRNNKMAVSVEAYVRGSTAQFYEWLENLDRGSIPEGPPVWICGDCHLGNLGPVASTTGRVEIQIRDLDQTTIGNPAHDLIRLGLSLAMAARGSALPGVTTARMLEKMMEGYEAAFSEAGSDQLMETPDLVKHALRRAAGRSWKHLADERIEGIEPNIPLGKRFWPLTSAEKSEIHSLFAKESLRELVTSLRARQSKDVIEVLDAAYWRKGCSSLGRLRFAVLVAIKGVGRERHCLIDIKEAIAAVAPRDLEAKMPRDNAERVAEGARHLSPFLGDRMLPLRLLGKAVFARELLPQDLKLELNDLSQDEAMSAARYLSTVVGRAHARQMGTLDGGIWLDELKRKRPNGLDAPTWLWSSVVDLIGIHERAYLEHCRRFALGSS